MDAIYFFWFGLCFICYLIRTIYNVSHYQKKKIAENKKIITSIYITMFVLWFSWFQMCFIDPVKMTIPEWSRYIGLILFILGFVLFILSHMRLKGFEDRGQLVTGGIYSKIRNPMYLGFIIWIIGFPVFTRSLFTFVSSIIWVSYILYWKKLEEKELEEKYEEYAEYKKRTWL